VSAPPPPPPHPGLRSVPTDQGPDQVLVEAPLVIEVGEESILTMRTPGHDDELALGFLLGEGILRSASQVAALKAISPSPESPVARVRVELAPGVELSPVARTRLQRAHAIRPSCGLCGLATAEGLAQNIAAPASRAPRTSLALLSRILEGMRREQALFRATGGSHAAAVGCAETGEVWAVREDIGRHNALDKALGACVERPLARAAVVLSGRGGFELIVKAARLGVPVVASVSAPSSLAVEIADELGLTLVGFLREGSGRTYSDDERLS
jgi:FdhD protein